MMPVNRNIVVMREGNKLLLPTLERKEVDVPPYFPTKLFTMWRVTGYDAYTATISLKPFSDHVNDRAFNLSIEQNSELFSSLNIQKIVIVKSLPDIQIAAAPKFEMKDLEQAAIRFREQIREKEFAERKIQEEKAKEKHKEIISLQLPVKDLKFLDSKVCFDHYIRQIASKITFEIQNPFIKKEHDTIKNYFPKALGIDKFTITGEVEHAGGKTLNQTASSLDISRINASLFELVEDFYIDEKIISGLGEGITTIDIIATESANQIGSENMEDPRWLLNKLLAKERTKHHYHLRYLSDKHIAAKFPLRLTGKPISFIFILSTESNYCLIWETYSTKEATYIWNLKSTNEMLLEKEMQYYVDLIKELRQGKKRAYLATKPEKFLKIDHQYSGDDFGFKKWKSQLEEFIKVKSG
jgi:hypothetical protein